MEGVDVGDFEAVEDDAGGGAAADAHGDAFAAGEGGEVADDEEVFGEAGFFDDGEFVVEAIDLVGGGRAVALFEPFGGEVAEVLHGIDAGGRSGLGSWRRPNSRVTSQRSAMTSGVVDRFGEVGEALVHFVFGGEVEVVAVELEAVLLVHGAVGADAEKDFVADGVVGVAVVGIVGGDEGGAGGAAEVDEFGMAGVNWGSLWFWSSM